MRSPAETLVIMKNRWVALSSSVLVFVNTMFLTRQNAQVMPGFERDRGCDISGPVRSRKSSFPVSSAVGTFSFSCGFLPSVCFLGFFPLTIILLLHLFLLEPPTDKL